MVFVTGLAIDDPQNKSCEKHMLEFEESLIGWISQVTRNSSQVASDSRLKLVAFWSVTFLILYQHYINPDLPRNVRRRMIIF